MKTLEANKATARTFFQAMSKLDGPTLMSLVTSDFVLETKGTSVVSGVRTAKELPGMVQILSALLPNGTQLDILSLTAEEDRVVCQAVGSAITVTGKPYRNEYLFLLEFRDGKVAKLSEYMDTRLVDELFGPVIKEMMVAKSA